MRRNEYRRPLDEDDLDSVIYCPECDTEIHVWIGMSVVECPKCGKVFL